jgi:protein-disulfide isomerase
MSRAVNTRGPMGSLTPTRARLEVLASIVLIVAACLLVWLALDARLTLRELSAGRGQALRRTGVTPSLPPSSISLADAHVRGSPDARVILVEFVDFECPYCGRFAREVQPTLIPNPT